ncbi:MAG: tetratricopeptide repeat protein [Rhodobacteraceae bacterium]|nr:tetratricopeptide repeat protein [Paracoccaceae bacterium]
MTISCFPSHHPGPRRPARWPGLLVSAFLVILPCVSAAADFEDGWVAYVNGDYTTALEEWLPLAEMGHLSSQVNLGVMHEKGLGVEADAGAAAAYFQSAAEFGHHLAQFNLGVLYRDGRGVSRDPEQAFEWFTKSAVQGNPHAQTAMALAFLNGEGVEADVSEGLDRLIQAASTGNAMASYELGKLYEAGRHVSPRLNQAARLEVAIRHYVAAASSGVAMAGNRLGVLYSRGKVINPDPEQAYIWFSLATAYGHETAKSAAVIVRRELSADQLQRAEAVIFDQGRLAVPSLVKFAETKRDELRDEKSRISQLSGGQWRFNVNFPH